MSKLIVISAPSGGGKTTLCARLLRDFPELILSVSTTTRPPRGSERDGEHYFFVARDAFQGMIAGERFAEWAEVHGNFYGTTKDFVEQAFSQGKSLLLDIDVQGAESLRKAYPERAVTIFIRPPSLEELERRLRGRRTDSEETIRKRVKNAEGEMKHLDRFDHVVVNDEFEHAYLQLRTIVAFEIRGVRLA